MEKHTMLFEEFTQKGTYEVGYYDKQGGHGDAGQFKTFKQAIKSAEQLKKNDEKKENLGKLTMMIDVSSENTTEFAIIYMTPEYIKMADKDYFADVATYKKWMEVAKKCLETGKTVISDYEK